VSPQPSLVSQSATAPRRTWFAFGVVIAAWGSSYLFIKVAVTSFTPFGLVLVRFALAATLCGGLSLLRSEPRLGRPAVVRFIMVGVLMAGSNGLTAFAQQQIPSGWAGVVHALSSVWLAALGSVGAFGRDVPRTPLKTWLGVVLGVVGVSILMWPEDAGSVAWAPMSALCLATFSFSAGSVLQRRTQAIKGALFRPLGWQMFGSALTGAVLCGGKVVSAPISQPAFGAVLVLTLFASIGGFGAYFIVLRDWPPARVGSLTVINPVVAVLLGIVVAGEPFSIRVASATLVTMAGVLWVQWSSRSAR
jgi:drug/metabolite transporter (DMT)-like permease